MINILSQVSREWFMSHLKVKVFGTCLTLPGSASHAPYFSEKFVFLIVIFQVSENQSSGCHKRMSNRIYQLLDTQLRNTIHALYIEEKAREAVKVSVYTFFITESNWPIHELMTFEKSKHVHHIRKCRSRFAWKFSLLQIRSNLPQSPSSDHCSLRIWDTFSVSLI